MLLYLKQGIELLLNHPFLKHEQRRSLPNQKQILLRFPLRNGVSVLLLKEFLRLEHGH